MRAGGVRVTILTSSRREAWRLGASCPTPQLLHSEASTQADPVLEPVGLFHQNMHFLIIPSLWTSVSLFLRAGGQYLLCKRVMRGELN